MPIYCQKNRTLFFALLSIFFSGCQSLSNYHFQETIEIPFDNIETEQFSLINKQDIIGQLVAIKTQENDTLPDIARHFALGYNDITIANASIDPWVPATNSQLILPLQFIIPAVNRKGIILNLASMRLFYFPKNQPNYVMSYPVGIGRNDWETPTGNTKITEKKKDPVWRVPLSILKEHAKKGDPLPRIVPAGPDNPLGQYAMRLGIPSYLIHGTNKPYGVGMQISHGCVRLYPENIEDLFKVTPVGTPVKIIDQPYLLGWDNQTLFLEAHQPLQKNNRSAKKNLFKKLRRIARNKTILIDWLRVETILKQATGIPSAILENSIAYNLMIANIPRISHPSSFNQQPIVSKLSNQDWSMNVASFNDENAAKKLVAMLNHQSPMIPSRVKQDNNLYQVIAGPYASEEETHKAIQNIQQKFELTVVVQPPHPPKIERWWDIL